MLSAFQLVYSCFACRVPVAAKDPVVAIACLRMRADALSAGGAAAAPAAAPVVAVDAADLAPIGGEDAEEVGGGLGDGVGGSSPPTDPSSDPNTSPHPEPGSGASSGECSATRVEAVVFTWAAGGTGGDLRRSAAGGADVRVFGDEGAMLAAWQEWLLDIDPDVLAIFQVPLPGRIHYMM